METSRSTLWSINSCLNSSYVFILGTGVGGSWLSKLIVGEFVLGIFVFTGGVGGFVGFNYYMMQKIKYSNKKKIKEIGNEYFNLEKFTYGLSSYVGYGNARLFVKYNINPMFKNQDNPMNNLSFGLSLAF